MTDVMHTTETNGNGNGSARRSILNEMATRYQMSSSLFESTIKKTVLSEKASNEELLTFLLVAKQYDLNPFTREIYGFPGKGGGIQVVISIDGWIKIINSHEQLDGIEFEDNTDAEGNLASITAILWRKDRSHPITVTEYFSECRRATEPWKQWPHRMLRHKALIQAARYAFGFAGIVDPDEAERMHDVSPMREVNPPPPKAKRELKDRMQDLAHGKNGDPKTPNGEAAETIDADTGEIITETPDVGSPPPPTEGEAAGPGEHGSNSPDPAVNVLEDADKSKLTKLHDALSFATGKQTVDEAVTRWAKIYPAPRNSAIRQAAALIRQAHLARVDGKSSPAETDETVARYLE